MEMQHNITFYAPAHFAGWPANNGLWLWDGNEILVGFAHGGYAVQPGHNIVPPISLWLARSLDGGQTWHTERPPELIGDRGTPTKPPGGLDFTHPGFALRAMGVGYHGCEDARGRFYYSLDRGRTWCGPFHFGGLGDHPELRGMELTPRTDYIVEGPGACLLMLSARQAGQGGADRVFCARTTDGGASFRFVAWVVSPSDPHRAVMPATVRCGARALVTAVRRRAVPADRCWVDAYASHDDGQSWAFLSHVGDTGPENGNPPALVRLGDGRLCCAYGNRARRQMVARFSADGGATWGDEQVLRADYASLEEDADLGYPRAVQRADGCLVVLYYWATRERPYQHIAATILSAPAPSSQHATAGR